MTDQTSAFTGISAGFKDTVADAQSVFRRILDATSHPGRIVEVPENLIEDSESGLSIAAAAIALTLLDFETPVWLDTNRASAGDFLRFHCGAPLVTRPKDSRFAFASDAKNLPDLAAFDLGTPDFPERSTTLIVEVNDIAEMPSLRLSGPGIATSTQLLIDGVPNSFWQQRRDLAGLFPLGIDLIFTCRHRLCVVPRTTSVEI